jgi:hypothetical protein
MDGVGHRGVVRLDDEALERLWEAQANNGLSSPSNFHFACI